MDNWLPFKISEYTTNRASQISGFFLHSFSDFTSIQSFLMLCNSLVILECCCIVWFNFHNRDCCTLEAAQRKFTLWVSSPYEDYPSRFRTLILPSLQQPRIFLDMDTFLKLYFAKCDIIFRIDSQNTRSADIIEIPSPSLTFAFKTRSRDFAGSTTPPVWVL